MSKTWFWNGKLMCYYNGKVMSVDRKLAAQKYNNSYSKPKKYNYEYHETTYKNGRPVYTAHQTKYNKWRVYHK